MRCRAAAVGGSGWKPPPAGTSATWRRQGDSFPPASVPHAVAADRRTVLQRALRGLPVDVLEPLLRGLRSHADRLVPGRIESSGDGACAIGMMLREMGAELEPAHSGRARRRRQREISIWDIKPSLARAHPRLHHVELVFDSHLPPSGRARRRTRGRHPASGRPVDGCGDPRRDQRPTTGGHPREPPGADRRRGRAAVRLDGGTAPGATAHADPRRSRGLRRGVDRGPTRRTPIPCSCRAPGSGRSPCSATV